MLIMITLMISLSTIGLAQAHPHPRLQSSITTTDSEGEDIETIIVGEKIYFLWKSRLPYARLVIKTPSGYEVRYDKADDYVNRQFVGMYEYKPSSVGRYKVYLKFFSHTIDSAEFRVKAVPRETTIFYIDYPLGVYMGTNEPYTALSVNFRIRGILQDYDMVYIQLYNDHHSLLRTYHPKPNQVGVYMLLSNERFSLPYTLLVIGVKDGVAMSIDANIIPQN